MPRPIPPPAIPADFDAAGFARALKAWFRREGKDYPWRRTRDPYAILVSELMLQQTQIATVLGRGFYARWMALFPTPAALADAPEETVLKAWEGLGYYQRARNLQRAARAIAAEHAGVFPRDPAAIRALPGVGRYTAGAVASFAFGQAEPIVDGNVARVLARVFDFRGEVDSPAGGRFLWAAAEALVPGSGAREFNSGLMELGQTHCAAKSPKCLLCPVRAHCRAADPESLPRKKAARPAEKVDEHAALIRRAGKTLLHRESGGRRRQGLWKLPPLPDTPAAAPDAVLKYGIMHYRVTLHIYALDAHPEIEADPDSRWFTEAERADAPMPSPYRRALAKFGG
ncbi:MAG: A/G-specific adenine glycosylase [Verrucomicrobiales bacterium]